MSAFDLKSSLSRAEQRLARLRRRRRSDAGCSRLPAAVEKELQRLLARHDRPKMKAVREALTRHCARHGLPCPSRATLYNAIARTRPPRYRMSTLPEHLRATLFNLSGDALVGGERVVFHAFNHGDTRALSFAAGLPWLCLHHAEALPGWRSKSLALLRAVMKERGI